MPETDGGCAVTGFTLFPLVAWARHTLLPAVAAEVGVVKEPVDGGRGSLG